MNQWLPWIRVSSGDGDDEDADISMISSNAEDIKKKNEKNLRRVIYVLASSYNQDTVQTLLNAVYESKNIEYLLFWLFGSQTCLNLLCERVNPSSRGILYS